MGERLKGACADCDGVGCSRCRPADSREEIGGWDRAMWELDADCYIPPHKARCLALIAAAFRLSEVERDREEIRELGNSAIQRNVGLILERDRLRARLAEVEAETIERCARVEAAIVKALDHGDAWMDHRVRESIRDIRCALQGQHIHAPGLPKRPHADTCQGWPFEEAGNCACRPRRSLPLTTGEVE